MIKKCINSRFSTQFKDKKLLKFQKVKNRRQATITLDSSQVSHKQQLEWWLGWRRSQNYRQFKVKVVIKTHTRTLQFGCIHKWILKSLTTLSYTRIHLRLSKIDSNRANNSCAEKICIQELSLSKDISAGTFRRRLVVYTRSWVRLTSSSSLKH